MAAESDDEGLRQKALARLKKKRDFTAHLISYVAVNGLLIIIWATTAGGGFFWPMFPLLGWGIGIFFHWWDVYHGEPSEQEIRKEIERISH